MEVTHHVAEQRSIALHREVARRLRAQPELLDRARKRVSGWADQGSVAPHWVRVWSELLKRPLGDVIAAITDAGQHGCDLRQTSPFAGVIDSATRWRILRDCERQRRSDEEGTPGARH
jgi:hypothetical protein